MGTDSEVAPYERLTGQQPPQSEAIPLSQLSHKLVSQNEGSLFDDLVLSLRRD
jgi:hypothetical protein